MLTRKQLTAKHPDYTNLVEDWQLYHDAYTGRGGFKGDYLIEHPREKDSKNDTIEGSAFKDRKEYSIYINYVRPIIDRVLGLLFRQQPDRDGSKEFLDWLSYCGGIFRGTKVPIDIVMKRHARNCLIYGPAHMVMDKPVDMPEAVTAADVDWKEYPPFIVHYTPIDLYDYSEDLVTGKLSQAKFAVKKISSDVFSGEIEEIEYYYLWDEKEAAVYSAKKSKKRSSQWIIKEEIERKSHGYSGPPIITTRISMEGEPLDDEVPFLDTIAQLSKELYNLMSERRAYYRNALAFPTFTFPAESPEQADKYLDIGRNNVIYYDRESKTAPNILRGDVSVLQQFREDIREIITSIKDVAAQRINQGGGQVKAAETLRQEAQETKSLLHLLGNKMEEGERKIADLWHEATGKDPEYSVNYPSDYDVDSLVLNLDQILMVLTEDLGPTASKQARKLLAKSLSDGDYQLYREMSAEIDALEEGRDADEGGGFPATGGDVGPA